MRNIIIVKGHNKYGPYSVDVIKSYLQSGDVFPHDKACWGSQPAEIKALSALLDDAGISYKVTRAGNPLKLACEDIRSLDKTLLFPFEAIRNRSWLKNRKLLYLAGAGLIPAVSISVTKGKDAAYWGIAFYFSVLWSLFFYYVFKTKQVKLKLCFAAYLTSAVLGITLALIVQNLPVLSSLYALTDSRNIISRMIGMIFGVGITEELCKAAVLFWLVKRKSEYLIPQTVVFYGMLAGLGFGIFEGVFYQQSVNREQGIDMAYFLNIARLTSLPFLHAVWTGIAGYFISFAALYPQRKFGLWVLAIIIPAFFHGMYNTFGWSIIGFAMAFLGVIFLMVYLGSCRDMQNALQREALH